MEAKERIIVRIEVEVSKEKVRGSRGNRQSSRWLRNAYGYDTIQARFPCMARGAEAPDSVRTGQRPIRERIPDFLAG